MPPPLPDRASSSSSPLLTVSSLNGRYTKKGNAVGGAGKDAKDAYSMSQREWVGMCKDAKIPVPIGEIRVPYKMRNGVMA